jgi:type VI secretion system protein ImpG
MFNRYFQQELFNLRDLGEEFSKAHPAVAPMLSGAAADPDVERLLEGVAFLTALLREKLDDDFPEIVHDLIQLIWPHYLRPIPSLTIVAFRPKPMLKQSISIPRGVQLASVTIEGTPCLFQTCYDVELHPLDLHAASFVEESGRPPAIKLEFELRGLSLSGWEPNRLRFFLAGNYATAAELFYYLRNHVAQIRVSPLEQGSSCVFSSHDLEPVGFCLDQGILPYPSHSFPGYRILQEYFILPEKFLFFDLKGWEKWKDRGKGAKFEVTFVLDASPSLPLKIRKENFVLYAAPAVNIFPHEADPIRLDHQKTEYLVRPSGANASHYQVYSIEDVVGFVRGTAQQRQYVPFEVFKPPSKTDPVYHSVIRSSALERGFDVYLSVSYPPDSSTPVSETLSLKLTCTNGALPGGLQVGDISIPTSSSPDFAEFSNIRPPTVNVPPSLGSNLLWRLLSHLSLNYVSLANADNLRALLELYIPRESRDRASVMANQKRAEGMRRIETKTVSRLVSGIMMRGQNVTLELNQDHFAGQGDLYLFGSVLDYFLGAYASLNTFTQLNVDELLKGDHYQWPVRIGDRFLI